MLTDAEIAAIRERIAASTQGEWIADRLDIRVDAPDGPSNRWPWVLSYNEFDGGGMDEEADVIFSAHAHQDIPTLLAEIDRLKAENKEFHDMLVHHGLITVAASRLSEDARRRILEAMGGPMLT